MELVCVERVRAGSVKWFPGPLWSPDGAAKQSTSKTFNNIPKANAPH